MGTIRGDDTAASLVWNKDAVGKGRGCGGSDCRLGGGVVKDNVRLWIIGTL